MPTEREVHLLPLRNRKREVVAHAVVDADVGAAASALRWYLARGGYVRHTTPPDENGKQKTVLLHRWVMGCEVGDGQIVDHIDHDPLNCRRENLRVVTHAENHQNRTYNGNRNTSSRYRGVSWSKSAGRWEAYAKLNGKFHHLGYFDVEEEARDVAAEWRRVNMPFSAEALAA